MRAQFLTRRLVVIALMAAAATGCADAGAPRGGQAVSSPAVGGSASDVAAARPAPPPSPTPTTAQSPAPTTSTQPPPPPTSPPAPTFDPVAAPLRDLPTGIEPTRIEIPSIGVDATVVQLSLAGAEPEVPSEWDDAGWYQTTRNPGEIGPAVIAGHVDSKAGPAVFFRIGELTRGDEIIVHDARGRTRTFEVMGRDQHPKTALPEEVFGFGQPRPELRLITCGGTFDRTVGHYLDNLVVYAAAT